LDDYLWNTDHDAYCIYQLKTDGTQIKSFSSNGPYPRGIAWDGSYLWDSTLGYIYQIGSSSDFDITYQVTSIS